MNIKTRKKVFSIICYTLMFFALAVFVLIISERNTPHIIAFKYLSIPIFLFSIFFTFRYPELLFKKHKNKKWFHKTLMSIFMGLIIILFAGQCVAFFNAVLLTDNPVEIRGKIIHKNIGQSRRGSIIYSIKLDTLNTYNMPYSFYVNRDFYTHVNVGDEFKGTFNMGRFGIVYNWRY